MQSQYSILECVSAIGNNLVLFANFLGEKSLEACNSFWEPVEICAVSLLSKDWLKILCTISSFLDHSVSAETCASILFSWGEVFLFSLVVIDFSREQNKLNYGHPHP